MQSLSESVANIVNESQKKALANNEVLNVVRDLLATTGSSLKEALVREALA
jgi:hypothetical protein